MFWTYLILEELRLSVKMEDMYDISNLRRITSVGMEEYVQYIPFGDYHWFSDKEFVISMG